METLEILLKATDHASNPLKSVKSSLDGLVTSADKVNKKLSGFNNMVGGAMKAAAGIGIAAVGGLTAAIISSTQAAADMDQQVADIAAVMNKTKDEVAPLKDLIQDLGLDPSLKVDATEAASAIEMLAKNGLDMGQILDGAARSTVLLSNATGADMANAADIATDAMSLFNIKATDMDRAVNGIVGVTQLSKFGIEDYALALGTGAKGAVAAEISFDQFNQMLTATSSNFTSGMTAGTSLTAMMLGLAPRTDKAAGVMQELGIITKEGANRFFDMNGQVRSNAELSAVLQDTIGKLAPEQRLLAVNTIFGRDALAAVNGMINVTDDSWNTLSTTLSEVDAQQQAATRMDTLSGSMEILRGILDGVKLQIGDKFLPVFKTMVERITDFVSKHADKIVAWAGAFADKLAVLLEQYFPVFLVQVEKWLDNGPAMAAEFQKVALSVVPFITKIIDIIGQIIKFIDRIGGLETVLKAIGILMAISTVAKIVTFVSGIMGAVSAVGSFIGALTGIGPIIATVIAAINPITLVIAAVVAAIIGLKIAWDNNFLGIRDITNNAITAIKGWISSVPQSLTDLGNNLRHKGHEAMNKLREGFDAAKNFVRSGFDGVIDWIHRGKDEKLPPLQQALFNAGQTAFNRMSEGFNSVKNAVKEQVTRFLDDVKEHGFTYATGALAGRLYSGARDAFNRFKAGFNETAPSLKTDFQGALTSLTGIFNSVIDGFRNHVFNPAQGVVTRIRDGLTSIDLGGAISGKLNDIVNSFNSWKDSIVHHFYGSMQYLIGRIRDGINDTNIVHIFSTKLNDLVSTFNSWKDGIVNHFFESMKGLGKSMIDGLADGIRNQAEKVRDALNWLSGAMPQWVKDALGIGSPSKVFKVIGKWVPPGLAEGIMASADVPRRALSKVMNNMVGAMDGYLGSAAPSTMPATSTSNNTIDNSRKNTFNITVPTNGRNNRFDEQTYGVLNTLSAIYV